ncbi:LysR substrate-binding domain-containing protein [Pigmentiphaga soli]|uniref:LysR substrate-binding domain-containing protein n=1 Tax=Pigmentiphaga soli TaxID=1007095 RepID=A0ABP8H197_9BURK
MNINRIDLATLSLFSKVAKTGSITRGAHAAGLAVGAASKRIADLEATLGVALLERHSRGIHITPAGRTLEDHARRILADVSQMVSELADHAAGHAGAIRIWANTSAATQYLPEVVARFLAANPGTRIELEHSTSGAAIIALLQGEADVAVFVSRTPPAGIQSCVFRADQLVLAAPRGHPLAARRSVDFSEVLDYDFICLPPSTSLAIRLREEAEAQERRVPVRFCVKSYDAMCRLVGAGLGVAVLPSAALQTQLAQLPLVQVGLNDPWTARDLLLGVRDFGALPPIARSFVASLCPQGVFVPR